MGYRHREINKEDLARLSEKVDNLSKKVNDRFASEDNQKAVKRKTYWERNALLLCSTFFFVAAWCFQKFFISGSDEKINKIIFQIEEVKNASQRYRDSHILTSIVEPKKLSKDFKIQGEYNQALINEALALTNLYKLQDSLLTSDLHESSGRILSWDKFITYNNDSLLHYLTENRYDGTRENFEADFAQIALERQSYFNDIYQILYDLLFVGAVVFGFFHTMERSYNED